MNFACNRPSFADVGVKKLQNFADVLYGWPLKLLGQARVTISCILYIMSAKANFLWLYKRFDVR